MWLLLISLLIYCGLGLIIHENKYKHPTARFKRGLKRSTPLQFVVFALSWITIIFSPRIYDRWARLSYITGPPYPVAMGTAVVVLFAVLILGSFSGYQKNPASVSDRKITDEYAGGAQSSLAVDFPTQAELPPVQQVLSPATVVPDENWVSIMQVVPISAGEIHSLIGTGVVPADIDRDMKEFLGIPGKYPEASTRLLTPVDLKNRTGQELRVMRNEIFARHSYIFTSGDMRDYFSREPWFTPRYSSVASRFNEFERANIDVISEYERK